MLDMKLFRSTPDELRALLGAKRYDDGDVERACELDAQRRALLAAVETARAEKNVVSKRVGRAADDERQTLIAEMQALNDRMAADEAALQQVQTEFDAVASRLPNPPHPDVPASPSSDDVEGSLVRVVGTPPAFDFEPKDHLELGERLGWVNMAAAARLSGSRFAYLHGGAVLLQHALVTWVGGLLHERGFTLTIPPVLVREKGMFDTGFFPADAFEIYKLQDEDLYLVGTSEVPLAALHVDETIPEERLPLRYAGYSSCFRREAGAYGKDTRGIFRVHQFDKLEMFSFCHPDKSGDEHAFILSIEEDVARQLGLHYRVVDIAASTLGAPAARKFDVEAWIPSQRRFREITSCSNCTDFQARRLGARCKGGKQKSLVHTLNGTAVAVGRTLIALIETHQQADGSIAVPAVLRPYLPGAPERLG